MDEQISTFCAFTDATPEQAQRFLALTEGNVEHAVELFFSDPSLGSTAASTHAPPQPPSVPVTTAPTTHSRTTAITIDDDDDDMHDPIEDDDDDDVQMLSSRPVAPPAPRGPSIEDDEAMARRLQEEMYGGGAGGQRGVVSDVDQDGVRAPMARTTETLVGPNADWRDDPGSMNAAIMEQLAARQRGRGGARGPAPGIGIFNQRPMLSIWQGEGGRPAATVVDDDDPDSDPDARRRMLSRATAGASDATAKTTLLADLFRPPFDLISPLSWSDARDEGKAESKWLLVNIQDPSIFDCQVLNRDIWKNSSVRDTIQAHFIFLQYNKDDPRGHDYINYYFAARRDIEDAYPYIAIVDPRTGEQVKTWSGSPAPKASDFLMDLHEFLDRYSLSMERKNPVQTKRKEGRKDVAQMSEEEMLEMALQNSLAANGVSASSAAASAAAAASKDEDPDALTRTDNHTRTITNGKGKAPAGTSYRPTISDDQAMETDTNTALPSLNNHTNNNVPHQQPTPFSLIPSNKPHTEPPSVATPVDGKPTTTRIQFRYNGGRVVRRFLLTDRVSRLYEWLKAEPLPGQPVENSSSGGSGAGFELVSGGRNLIEMLEMQVGEAGLGGGTVMVEFIEGSE